MGAAAASSGADLVSVDNSALFSGTNYLARTPSTTGVEEKGTLSRWIYRTKPGVQESVFAAYISATQLFQIYFPSDDTLHVYNYSGGYDWQLATTQVFRDIGWIHIVVAIDTTQAVEDDRAIIYINGERVTALATTNYPSLNFVNDFNTASVVNNLGPYDGATGNGGLEGYAAETVWIDGLQLTPTSFGAYDSSGLYWTPLASATIQELTFGTNGFYLANKVTDAPQLDFQGGDDNTVILSQYKSLLHFDGSDTSTTFTDSSSSASNWTAAGNAQLDTAYKKFGTASLLLDGTGDYAYHTTLATVGTQDFTIDLQVRRNGANTDNAILTWGDSGADTGLRILSSTDNKLIVSTGNAAVIGTGDHSTSLPDGEFAHVEMVRSGSTLYLFQNGTLLSSKSFSYNLSSTSAWWIGDDVVSSGPSNFNGHIDEVRVAIGYAAHTSGFTAPTSAYSNPPTANNFSNNGSVTTSTLVTPTKLPRLLWNPLSPLFAATLSEGGTKTASSGDTHEGAWANTNFPKTGKWQTEVLVTVNGASAIVSFGIMKNLSTESLNQYIQPNSDAYGFYVYPTELPFYSAGTELFDVGAVSRGTYKYQICWDASAGDGTADVYFGIDNTFYDNDGTTDGNPATGSNPTIENLDISTSEWSLLGIPYNAGTLTTADEADWEYTIQSGYTALTQTNIAASVTRTASDSEKYFQTILYEGNGAGQRVGNFQPFGNSFTVGNSALFDYANNEILKRTNSSGGNETKWTFSTWVKFTDISAAQIIFGSNAPTISPALWFGDTTRALYFTLYNGNFYSGGGSYVMSLQTDPLPDDETQWMHIVAKYDSTVSTPSSSSIAIYVNGVQQGLQGTETYPGQNQVAGWNSANEMLIGTAYNSNLTTQNLRAYMAETVNIDGLALGPDSFGQTDTTTNRWIPKDVSGLTFGTNGFYLNYANSSDVGNDVSGNNNDWTNVNTVTQTTDSPTTNITVLSPNRNLTGGTPSNGNRTILTGSSQYGPIWTEMGLSSGKWYWEGVVTAKSATNTYAMIGVTFGDATSTTQELGYRPFDFGYYSYDGRARNNNAWVTTGWATWVLNDVMGVALDMDAKTVSFYKNNSLQGSVVLPSDGPYYPAFCDWDGSSTVTWTTRFASADWSYSAPTDHIAITQDNMTSSNQFISAFSWIKNRDATDNHMLFDRVRGVNKDIHSNDMVDEVTNVNTLQQFLAGGVQIGNDVEVNTANESYVLWDWMMEATGTGSSNTDGTINTTSTLVDTTLGMSISTYVGTGSNATIGHGLGVKPGLILLKVLNSGGSAEWIVYHSALTTGSALFLNSAVTQAASAGYFNNTQPTSSVFTVGTSTYNNASGKNHVAYCFRDSQFISIGSYGNNNNANGQFVPTLNSLGVPIQPVWVLTKTLASANWMINDVARIGYNVDNNTLYPNATTAEATVDVMDIVTGGFKLRTSNDPNYSTSTTVYMAIGTPIIDTDGRIIAGR